MNNPNKNNTVRLRDALTNGNVSFVFGAGASLDYGFPTWLDLRSRIDDILPIASNIPGRHKNKIREWLEGWSDGSLEKTVDEMVFLDSGNDFTLNHTFQKLLFVILLMCERKRVLGGWIRQFSRSFTRYLNVLESTQECLEELSKIQFITLNYDRCFEFCYSADFPFYDIAHKFHPTNATARVNFVKDVQKLHSRVIHPHGAIGLLKSTAPGLMMEPFAITHMSERLSPVGYGDVLADLDYDRCSIVVADHAKSGPMQAYDKANSVLWRSKTVFIVGLSEMGLNHSSLTFNPSSQIHYWNPNRIDPAFSEKGDMKIHLGDAMDFAESL